VEEDEKDAPREGRTAVVSKKSEEKLTPLEWQARHDAACAIVARKYCDMLGFWRTCRYRPCRSAGRCSGDQGACLERGWTTVSCEIRNQAHERMIADTPADADRFTSGAHRYPPYSGCLHDPKNQKRRTA
jgi:hypothetical protein